MAIQGRRPLWPAYISTPPAFMAGLDVGCRPLAGLGPAFFLFTSPSSSLAYILMLGRFVMNFWAVFPLAFHIFIVLRLVWRGNWRKIQSWRKLCDHRGDFHHFVKDLWSFLQLGFYLHSWIGDFWTFPCVCNSSIWFHYWIWFLLHESLWIIIIFLSPWIARSSPWEIGWNPRMLKG